MSVRLGPMAESVRRWGGWPLILGAALGLGMASAPPKSFADRIGPIRPGPGRLVGFAYAPEGWKPSPEQLRVLRGETVRLDHELEKPENRTTESLRQRAVLALVEGKDERSVDLLEEAIERLPTPDPKLEAVLRSDLAATHLKQFVKGVAPIASLEALDNAARAVAASPEMVEGRSNLGAALQRVGLGRRALSAWKEVAAAERDPDWVREASERARVLADIEKEHPNYKQLELAVGCGDSQAASELVRRNPQRARELAGRDLLWDWGRAVDAHRREEADCLLGAVRTLAVPLAHHGDKSAADVVAILSGASPTRIQVAARGLVLYAEGYPQYRAFDNERGMETLGEAEKDLASAGLPQAIEVNLYLAVLEHNSGLPSALGRMRAVEEQLAGRRYPGLSALSAWIRGLLAGWDGRPYDQAEAYRQARRVYARLGEAENTAAIDGLLAQALGKLGRRKEALESYLAAALVAPRVRDPYRRRLIWGQLASFARERELLHAALVFQDEMYRAAAAQEDPTAVLEPLLLGASLRETVGDTEGANADLASARALVAVEPDREDRDRTMADLARVEEELLGKSDPAAGARSLDRAVALYARIGQGILEVTSRAVRVRARTAAGDLRGAEEDLQAIVAFARRGGESWLAGASDEDRYTFGREVQRAFAAMVHFQAVEAHQPWRAFIYQEMARELLAPTDSLRSGLPASLEVPTLSEIRAALPADVVLVEYALIEDRILVWLVAREGVATFNQPAKRSDVAWLVNHLNPRSGTRPATWRETSAQLFEVLIRPIEDRLPLERTLVVIPDGALIQIPWSGLWDSKRERYLVEERAVLVNPSAAFYLRALARAIRLGPVPSTLRALVVGDPAFDQEMWPRFQRLPGARNEAKRIGALYGSNAEILTESRATWSAFEMAARNADVIHLATHAAIDPVDPFNSYLLFAGPKARQARSLRDLASLKLPRSRLVILAACEVIGFGSEGEGITGLARPFLDAGVPAIVGPVWPIPDRMTQRLSLEFHRALIENGIKGFRLAQQAAARDFREKGSEDLSWSGFVMLGQGG